jgi:peptidylprolyl isomerase
MIMARWPDAVETESGLKYVVIEEGTGDAKPKVGQRVAVVYTGKLFDERVFDTSLVRGKPSQFELGDEDVVKGMNEAIADMKLGEKRVLIVPPGLGYGDKGHFSVVPPNSYLIYDLQLVGF